MNKIENINKYPSPTVYHYRELKCFTIFFIGIEILDIFYFSKISEILLFQYISFLLILSSV